MPTLRMTEAQLCCWLGTAAAGDSLEYHRGFLAVDVAPHACRLGERERKELVRVAGRAMWAADRGWVHLVQRRHGPDDYSYVIKARPRPRLERNSVLAILAEVDAAAA